jgi:hypothetical protein
MRLKCGIPSEESDLTLRALLSDVMASCGKDRKQIASELSQKIGRVITVSILNDYTRTTKIGARFPAAYVRGFCEVTGDDALQRFFLGSHLRAVVELGERELTSQRNRAAKDDLVRKLLAGKDRG